MTGSGQEVTIPSGSSVTATLADTYSLVPGSLTVNKLIAGPAAGSQGAVTIQAVCNGTALGDLTSPPECQREHTRTPGRGIPANSSCVVTETANGSNSTVKVTTVGSGQTVSVGPGKEPRPPSATPTPTWRVR